MGKRNSGPLPEEADRLKAEFKRKRVSLHLLLRQRSELIMAPVSACPAMAA